VVAWGTARGLGRLLPEGLKLEPMILPFIDEASAWLDAQRVALAADVGGGRLNPDASSMIETAAMQRLFSKFWGELALRAQFTWRVTERAEDGTVKQAVVATELALAAARMGDASRQSLLAAWECSAKSAQARAKAGPADPHAALAAALAAERKAPR
jgi:hypothetical protein